MHLLILLATLLLMIILLGFDLLRLDLIAMCVLTILGITGVVPPSKLFAGFSSSAVISIIGVMIIGAGMEKTGLMGSIATWALKLSRGGPKTILLLMSLVSGCLAGFLRSAGGAALMLPIINRVCLFLDVPRSRMLMPIGFCAIIGGTLTLIGSGPLLVLNDIINNFNLNHGAVKIKPLSFFSVLPIGLSILLVVILFFMVFGRFFLSSQQKDRFKFGIDRKRFDRTYGYGGKFYELVVNAGSELAGKSVSDLEKLTLSNKIAIVGVSKGNELVMPPLRRTPLEAGCHIALMGNLDDINQMAIKNNLKMLPQLDFFLEPLNPMRSGFSEVVIPPGSELINVAVNQLHMRRNHNVQVLAIYRGNRYRQGDEMKALQLRSGDTLGIFSEWKYLEKMERHPEFAIVTTEYPRRKYLPHKRPLAIMSFLVSLGLILLFHYAVDFSLMVGALLMMLTGVIEVDEAYHSVSWRTIFLIAGLLPFGYAMNATGAADFVSHQLLVLLPHGPVWVILGVLSILAMLLSLLMTNVGATLVLVPIALKLAMTLHVDPRLFAVVTAVATSNSFLIPTHQVNALIKGPGGYGTMDFVKTGVWVSLLYLVVLLLTAYTFLGHFV